MRLQQAGVLVLLIALQVVSCRQLLQIQAVSSDSNREYLRTLHLPGDPIFQDPWVKNNIAVTYGHKVQDGIGSQTLRMLAVYALSTSLGIGHVFRPLGCVGHIGNQVHYRNTGCNFTDEAARRQLTKAQQMINLPTTVTGDTSSWKTKFLGALDWMPFVKDINEALKKKQPTLFEIERVNNLIRYYPDIFLSIPALRPSNPLPPLSCRSNTTVNDTGLVGRNKAWLLDALRIAVHIRRGDVITDNWHKRILRAEYFINIAKQITEALESVGCEYSVEVFIESPTTPEGVAEIQLLRQSIPNGVLLVDTDMLWSWQMMATADVVVMSNSMFSLSAALMNPNALTVHVPYNHYVNRVGMFKMRHWCSPLDENGTLPRGAIDAVRKRAGTLQAAELTEREAVEAAFPPVSAVI